MPSFDSIWEQKYSDGLVQRYPWDIVVSFVFRNYPKHKLREQIRILEVGCGTASNLWFAAREGFSVAGIDGSEAAIASARQRFMNENLHADLRVADFTNLPFADCSFDLVIDRGAIVCCGLTDAATAVHEVYRVLEPGGRFLFNPYSDFHSSRSSGFTNDDGLTTGITEGSMVGVGQLCFYGRRDIEQILSSFCILSMQHMSSEEMMTPYRTSHSEWRVVAEKPLLK